jgi:putative Ca2+/H+ antiporter (TMEM165/GDT1 family)
MSFSGVVSTMVHGVLVGRISMCALVVLFIIFGLGSLRDGLGRRTSKKSGASLRRRSFDGTPHLVKCLSSRVETLGSDTMSSFMH